MIKSTDEVCHLIRTMGLPMIIPVAKKFMVEILLNRRRYTSTTIDGMHEFEVIEKILVAAEKDNDTVGRISINPNDTKSNVYRLINSYRLD